MGAPAIALSLAGTSPFYWDMAVSWAADHLDELIAFWEKDTFINVNIPNSPGGPEGMAVTWPTVKHYQDTLTIVNARNDSRWCFLEFGQELAAGQTGSDFDAVSRNFASLSSVYNHPVMKRTGPLANGPLERESDSLVQAAGHGDKKE